MKKMKWGSDPEFSGPRNWYRESLIISQVLKTKKRGKILDFGCGSSLLLYRLSQKGFTGIGVDISKLAVKYLNSFSKKNGISKKISAKVGNVGYLYKTRDKFDVVLAGEVVEHIKDDRRVIKGFNKVLRKGGICVISVPAHQYLWDINDDFSSHFKRYEKEELIQLFSENGFKVVNVFYWGFPLSLLWHKVIYLPSIGKKMKGDVTYSRSSLLAHLLLSHNNLKRFFSIPFWFDNLFNWTNKGGGLILLAKKVN